MENSWHSVTTPAKLRELCVQNGWFTCGTEEQYAKLFYANAHGCPIEQIATIIWICSDDEITCRRDILGELEKAHGEYVQQSV